MKKAPLLVVLVVALTTALMLTRTRPSANPKAPAQFASTNVKPSGTSQSVPLSSITRFDWREVESTNYLEYVSNLRKVGCPEETIRDIVIADVNRLFDEKESKAVLATNNLPFWKTGARPAQLVASALAQQHERLEAERKGVLKQILGDNVDFGDRPFKVKASDVTFNLLDFLQPNERTQAVAIISGLQDDFDTRFKPLLGVGTWGKGEREQYAQYLEEKEQKLLETLGAEGKQEYELRQSPVADYLRFRFQGVDMSEAEFRTLFAFADQYKAQLDPFATSPQDPVDAQAGHDAKTAVWDKAAEIIGNTRLQGGGASSPERALGIK